MSLQNPRVFPATITTGNSVSTGIDMGGGYLYVSIEILTNTNVYATTGGTPFWIQGSSDNTNYRRIYEVYTNAVATAFQIQSSVCNAIVPLNLFNLRYIKLETSGTVTGSGGVMNLKVIATDSL